MNIIIIVAEYVAFGDIYGRVVSEFHTIAFHET